MKLLLSRRGQIWVETVVYTLIGLALIGLVLAILTPKIKEFRDRAIIEQSIESMNVFDSKMTEILDAPGNKRKIELTLERGTFYVDSLNDQLRFVFDEAHVRYSEPGVSLDIGRINVTTEELTKTYRITLTLDSRHDITFNGANSPTPEEFTPVSLPYEFFVENKGIQNNVYVIDITEGD